MWSCRSDIEEICDELIHREPLIAAGRRPQLRSLLLRLVEKQIDMCDGTRNFHLFKVLSAHILPLTNCAFNKGGDRFITGSYDRTCKASLLGSERYCCDSEQRCIVRARERETVIIAAHFLLPLSPPAHSSSLPPALPYSSTMSCAQIWDTATGSELLTLEGHKNVVYAIAFNNPFGNRVVTGSFDKTAMLWNSTTGKCLQTFEGHAAEIVCIGFDPLGRTVATGTYA